MAKKLDFSKPVKIKESVLSRRSDMTHYRGLTGYVDATGDHTSQCSVIWAREGVKQFRAFHNTNDLEQAVGTLPAPKPYYWLQTQAPAGNWTDNLGTEVLENAVSHGKWLMENEKETVRVVTRLDTVVWEG